jgi:hypothetical protein
MSSSPLIAVRIGSSKHLELIRKGYRTHHVNGMVAFLIKEKAK